MRRRCGVAVNLQEPAPLRDGSRRDMRRAVARVGLLGCGIVGSEVARALLSEDPRRAGFRLEKTAVAHLEKKRSVPIDSACLTSDALSVVKDPDIDVIVELI